MLADGLPLKSADAIHAGQGTLDEAAEAQVEAVIAKLQTAMWTHAGLLREDATMRQGLTAQAACDVELAAIASEGRTSRRLAEGQALSRVAHAILQSALARTESRGAHFRNDFPVRDDANFMRHSVLGRDGRVGFEEW
jgi:succinate dehydrogenase/fumarate reductase flavoprotein subunit